MKKFDVLVLSGGKGTRVKKFTKKIPKCLVDINGKPFLYHQLRYLKKNNFKNVLISIGYMGDKIDKYLKENIDFINYKTINDGNKLLGTGGATLKALKYMKNYFFIIYGDSYLNFKIKTIKKNNFITMALLKNKNNYDKSNVEFTNIKRIKYFTKNKKKALEYIDYGVSYANKSIFKVLKIKGNFNLSDFYEKISKRNLLGGFIVKNRFYEIGSYNGIKELRKHLK